MATRIYITKKLEETTPIQPSEGWADTSKLKAYTVPTENIEIVEDPESVKPKV